MSLRVIAGLAVALAALAAASFALQAHDRAARFDHRVVSGRPRYVSASLDTPRPVARSHGRAGPVPQIGPGWLRRTATRAGIPGPALRAYARAELTAPRGCGIGWTTLAGVGYVESHHGTLGGRTLGQDGRSSTPILGPALDGRGDLAAIPAAPGSRVLHGDGRWEHAVGPMQFLPATWAKYATDGDGDGHADPSDLDDAAAAAARYLCAARGDLDTGRGWERAVLAYNHSQAYVGEVYAAASAYARRTR